MILTQLIFLIFKIESLDELKVIAAFHLIGLAFELFKTHPSILAWSYPETAWFKIFTVPLYSGFMYSAVASYIIQAWKIFSLHISRVPSLWVTVPFGFLIYAHFFLRHYGLDLRWPLLVAVFLIYFRTQVTFIVVKKTVRKMPLALSFVLISFFLFVAENISTFLGAWQYPHQSTHWNIVQNTKMSAWFLLFIVSFIIVADLKLLREQRAKKK